ncbi:MAG: hypothetical protein ABI472_04510 [Ginsengibacter sp.]
MAANKTIAIITAGGGEVVAIANALVQQNYRLLLVLKDSTTSAKILTLVGGGAPHADLEIIECVKDGCWEADMIFIDIPDDAVKEVVEMIKEVATQKIVFSMSGYKSKIDGKGSLRNLLPHSKVVRAINPPGLLGTFIEGDDQEAVQTIYNILKTAGYHPTIASQVPEIKTS